MIIPLLFSIYTLIGILITFLTCKANTSPNVVTYTTFLWPIRLILWACGFLYFVASQCCLGFKEDCLVLKDKFYK